MRLAPLLLLFAPLMAQSKGTATAAPAADPYVGSFTGDGGSIMVRTQGSTYTGTIIADGAEYPYTARKIGRSLVGTFQAQARGSCSRRRSRGISSPSWRTARRQSFNEGVAPRPTGDGRRREET